MVTKNYIWKILTASGQKLLDEVAHSVRPGTKNPILVCRSTDGSEWKWQL